jgi:hypothetical protein
MTNVQTRRGGGHKDARFPRVTPPCVQGAEETRGSQGPELRLRTRPLLRTQPLKFRVSDK